MSSLAQALETPTQPESVTTISAIARVDYILRFSKQAVMVVDEQIALCSSVGSQFLSNLSPDHNAAYITMSAKLNDLQVRCRIIEQLFGNTLFDPEQSVAVSLINLAKKHQQPVSIVIDNSQLLSLQLTHELCQLAEVAKKSDHQISILMLSTPQGGLKVCQNQSLFHKKLAIISAQTGQLISHNAKQFKPPRNYFAITPMKKWLAFFVVLALIASGSVYLLFKRDVFSFSVAINNLTDTTKTSKGNSGKIIDTFVQVNKDVVIPTQSQATTNDIFKSLIAPSLVKQNIEVKVPEAADPVDIINAIEAFTQSDNEIVNNSSAIIEITPTTDQPLTSIKSAAEKYTDIVTEEESVDGEISLSDEQVVKTTEIDISEGVGPEISTQSLFNAEEVQLENSQPISSTENILYQGQEQGFVIQIAGFTQPSVLAEFLADYQEQIFFQYKRLVNNKEMTILTSQYYQNRQQAEQAITLLPKALLERSPWIKAISTINDEINVFQRSQSVENQVTIPAS